MWGSISEFNNGILSKRAQSFGAFSNGVCENKKMTNNMGRGFKLIQF